MACALSTTSGCVHCPRLSQITPRLHRVGLLIAIGSFTFDSPPKVRPVEISTVMPNLPLTLLPAQTTDSSSILSSSLIAKLPFYTWTSTHRATFDNRGQHLSHLGSNHDYVQSDFRNTVDATSNPNPHHARHPTRSTSHRFVQHEEADRMADSLHATASDEERVNGDQTTDGTAGVGSSRKGRMALTCCQGG